MIPVLPALAALVKCCVNVTSANARVGTAFWLSHRQHHSLSAAVRFRPASDELGATAADFLGLLRTDSVIVSR